MGRRPDWTLGKRKSVIGMLTASMMNIQTAKHFQACESSSFSLRTSGEFNVSARASARLLVLTYWKSVKQVISITGARRALAFLNSPQISVENRNPCRLPGRGH